MATVNGTTPSPNIGSANLNISSVLTTFLMVDTHISLLNETQCKAIIFSKLTKAHSTIGSASNLYWIYFLQHLDGRIRIFIEGQVASTIIPLLTANSSSALAAPSDVRSAAVTTVYRALVVILQELASGATSIDIIAQKLLQLHNEDDITDVSTYDESIHTDTISSTPPVLCQFLFTGLSFITMLYEATDNPPAGVFELRLPSLRDRAISRHNRSTIWSRLECEISTDNNASTSMDLGQLLSQFGQFVLTPCNAPANGSRDFYEDNIVASSVNYHTISKIGRLRIQWVDSLSLHLELHERSSILRLFAWPSFCALLCGPYVQQETILSNVFSGFDPSTKTHAYSYDFLVEVLCTYRILFGQHKNSFEAYAKIRPKRDCDPLLSLLCGTSCRKHKMYEELEVSETKVIYSASADFPLLGRRLLALQAYMNAQNPSDLRTLWHDKRDILRFYTFWAVVVVGGVGIILSATSTVLTAVQVAQNSRT